jgi:hypothetical protein
MQKFTQLDKLQAEIATHTNIRDCPTYNLRKWLAENQNEGYGLWDGSVSEEIWNAARDYCDALETIHRTYKQYLRVIGYDTD